MTLMPTDTATHEAVSNSTLILNADTREVVLDGLPIELTRLEFDLLAMLYRNPRRVITHTELLQAIWGSDWIGDEHAAEVYISRVRKKLGESARDQRLIRTVHGVGYRYLPHVPAPALPTHALFDETGTLVFISPPVAEILGWPVTEIIGTRFIPAKQKILRSPRFIATLNWYAELVHLKGFGMRTCVQDRSGVERDVDLDATFVYNDGRVAGLLVDYLWCD